jgi:hypothetical protein
LAPDILQDFLAPPNRFERALPGEGLDTPHAGRHSALAFEFEQADIAGAPHMGAAA